MYKTKRTVLHNKAGVYARAISFATIFLSLIFLSGSYAEALSSFKGTTEVNHHV
jgi:hypothetical protein